MRKMVALAAVMLLSVVAMRAQVPACSWAWFTLDPNDPSAVVNSIEIGVDSTFTLHAWQDCVDADVAGMEFVIGWNPDVLEATSMELDPIFDPFMFKGTNYPGDGNPGTIDTLPAARWYAAVCIASMGCNPLPMGEPYHVGSITFHVLNVGETDIDTTMYPPSSHTSMADPAGTLTVFPHYYDSAAAVECGADPTLWGPGPGGIGFTVIVPSTGVEEGTQIPTTYYMNKLTPNPFKTSTAIAYGIPKDTEVNLSVYDATGRKVRTLVSGHVKAGKYTVSWDGLDDAGHRLASGTYFVRLVTKDFSKMEKALLLK